MSFWGVEVKVDKAVPYVPPPEHGQLRITQATLGLGSAQNEKLALACKVGKVETLICSLREGATECTKLDIVLDQYAEFSVKSGSQRRGKGSIHLAGYHVVEEEQQENDEEGDMEGLEGDLDPQVLSGLTPDVLQRLLQLRAIRAGTDMNEDDDNDDDDEMDSEDDDHTQEVEVQRHPSVIIEEIVEDEAGVKQMKLQTQGMLWNPADNDSLQAGEATRAISTVIQEAKSGKAAKIASTKQIEVAAPAKNETVTELGDGGAKVNGISTSIEFQSGTRKHQRGSKEQAVTPDPDSGSSGDEVDEDPSDDTDAHALEDAEDDINDSFDSEADDSDAIDEEVDAEELEHAKEVVADGKRKAADARRPIKAAKKAKDAAEDASIGGMATIQADAILPETATMITSKVQTSTRKFPNGFIIENVSIGDPAGKLAKAGKKVVVQYVGRLGKTGKIFDETKGNKSFNFRLGVGQVIKGWDQGIVGMRVGDTRRLTVPPQMAYGSKGVPKVIPGNSTLTFDVTLIDVKG